MPRAAARTYWRSAAAVFVGRRADGDADGAVVDGLVDVGREAQATGGDIAPDHVLQPRFVDGNAAGFEDADLFRIDIKAEHVIAYFGQTGAADQSNITGTDNGDFHVCFLQGLIEFFAAPRRIAFPAAAVTVPELGALETARLHR